MIIYRKFKEWLDKFKPGVKFYYKRDISDKNYRIFIVSGGTWFDYRGDDGIIMKVKVIVATYSDGLFSTIVSERADAAFIYSRIYPNLFQDEIEFL